jgi:hypothetical protein
LAIALAAPTAASAALVPRFDRASARLGQPVTIYQPGGLGWLKGDRRPIRVYLVPAQIAGRVAFRPNGDSRLGPPRTRRAVYVGRMSIPRGRLRFRLPRLAPGRYAAVAWCGPCGGTLIGSVPYDVPAGVEAPRGSLLRVERRLDFGGGVSLYPSG